MASINQTRNISPMCGLCSMTLYVNKFGKRITFFPYVAAIDIHVSFQ